MPSNLYKRGATWWGRVQVGGAEQRRSLRTGDRTEAKRRLEVWLKELSAAVHFGSRRRSFSILGNYPAQTESWDIDGKDGGVSKRLERLAD